MSQMALVTSPRNAAIVAALLGESTRHRVMLHSCVAALEDTGAETADYSRNCLSLLIIGTHCHHHCIRYLPSLQIQFLCTVYSVYSKVKIVNKVVLDSRLGPAEKVQTRPGRKSTNFPESRF